MNLIKENSIFIYLFFKIESDTHLFLFYSTLNSSFSSILSTTDKNISIILQLLSLVNENVNSIPSILMDQCTLLFAEESKINEIHYIYPSFSPLFIQSCLIEYNNDVEKVLDVIDKNDYSPHLLNLKTQFEKVFNNIFLYYLFYRILLSVMKKEEIC